MAYISEEEINNIRESSDIVDIISSYIELKKSGNDYVGICPFHEDHSPSLHVSPRLGIYKCFVCNTGGTVFSFVSKYENVSYPESVAIVAKKSGIAFNHDTSHKENTKFKKEFNLMELSLKYYQNNLSSSDGIKAKEYLNKRGITDDIIKEFKLGLSLGNNGLYNYLNNKKEDLNLAYDIGLLNKNGIEFYDMFQDRILIPIFDISGNLVGYTGRCYLKDEKSKYINSRESIIYKKSDILFNFYNAKEYIKKEKEIIIVEGNMDAISMASYGINNVIALMGVVISPHQIEAIKRLNVKVILMLDSDNAGKTATINVGDEIVRQIPNLYVVRLTGAKDPDEYVQKYGIDALKENIKGSTKYIDFKLNTLKEDYNLNSPSELAEYIKKVIGLLNGIDDFEKDIIISKICHENNIDESLIKEKIKPLKKETIVKENKQARKGKYTLAVYELLYDMLLNKDFYMIFMNNIGYLKNKVERQYVSLVGTYIKKYNTISISGFMDYIEKYDDVKDLTEKVISSGHKDTISENEFFEIIKIVSQIINEEDIKDLKEKIKNETDVAKKLELMEKLTELKKEGSKNERN